MPGLDNSLKEKSAKTLVSTLDIPPVDSSWSTDLRATELKEIVDYLCEKESRALSGIVGCGGIGKTVLGVQLANHDKIKRSFRKVFYLRAGLEADSQQLLIQWYQQITSTKKLGDEKHINGEAKAINPGKWIR